MSARSKRRRLRGRSEAMVGNGEMTMLGEKLSTGLEKYRI